MLADFVATWNGKGVSKTSSGTRRQQVDVFCPCLDSFRGCFGPLDQDEFVCRGNLHFIVTGWILKPAGRAKQPALLIPESHSCGHLRLPNAQQPSSDQPLSPDPKAVWQGAAVLNTVIHPGGPFRVSWDLVGGFLLLLGLFETGFRIKCSGLGSVLKDFSSSPGEGCLSHTGAVCLVSKLQRLQMGSEPKQRNLGKSNCLLPCLILRQRFALFSWCCWH